MHANEKLINEFYEAFRRNDYRKMQQAYHRDATFSDPVFGHLNAEEVKAMWEMLLRSAKDLRIGYGAVTANDGEGSCRWDARYTFTGTGHEVHNIIKANFVFKDGKIYRHTDRFDFWRWSRMALGGSGLLMGWTPYLRHAVRKKVRGRLQKFMSTQR